MFEKNFENIAERRLLGELLQFFKKAARSSTIEWAESKRVMTSSESSISGKFDTSLTPAFKYIYNVCDNWFIHIVSMMKSSQIGASELENNIIGRKQDEEPCHTAVFFPGVALLKEYSRKRFQPFFTNCKVLSDKLNIGIPKPCHDYFTFPGGSVALKTLGSIQSVLSSPIPFIILEEFAQVMAEVAKQGDPLGLVIGRQKSFEIGNKKVLAFSTPTFRDFCNMEKLYKRGFQLIFKAKCHHCLQLIELSGWTMESLIVYDEYQDRYIDETFGKHNPESAKFCCISCGQPWTFKEKTQNIKNGLNYGFIDHCGDFSYGWHPKVEHRDIITFEEYKKIEPTINKAQLKRALKINKTTLIYSFQFPEILACFEATSDAKLLAAKKIQAEMGIARGDETLIKDWYNNSLGLPYSSGASAMEVEEMKLLRSNYIEHICPMEGLVLTAGIDMQENRAAVVIRAWGRNNNSWLVSWYEIFGNALVQERDDKGNFIGLWGEMRDRIVTANIPHASGKSLKISAISIDSGDNTELVYKWVLDMQQYNPHVLATKGVRDLKHSDDEIYRIPGLFDVNSDVQARKTLAETLGVVLYPVGAHRAHEEVLNRIALNKNPDARSNIHYFNEQSYGGYEEQMTSCRKIIDTSAGYNKSIFKLIPGKRKEVVDCEKLALHASYAVGIRNYTHQHWSELENYFYN